MHNFLRVSLDKKDRIPLYFQIKRYIAEQIKLGKLASGEILPSEHILMKVFNVSRATVRQALSELEKDGLIERKQGVGSFVKARIIEPEIVRLTSFSDDMKSRGLTPGSQILEIENIVPNPKIMGYLGLQCKIPIWYVRRLRFANEEPIGLQNLYIPPWIKIEPDELSNLHSYYELLRNKGIKLDYARELLTARNATKREAELLRVRTGSSLLIADRVTYDQSNRCVEYVQFIYRADRYQYRLTLYA